MFLFSIGFDALLEEVEDLKLDTPDAAEVTYYVLFAYSITQKFKLFF